MSMSSHQARMNLCALSAALEVIDQASQVEGVVDIADLVGCIMEMVDKHQQVLDLNAEHKAEILGWNACDMTEEELAESILSE